MQRILVTGATGFVGPHLLAQLTEAFPGAALLRSDFDLRDHASIHEAIRRNPPDACFHLAAISAIQDARADPELAWQVNLHGTLALARALLAAAPTCTLLYASTADAYGASFRGGAPVTEATALAPLNIYSATKAAADLALGAMAAEGLRVIRLRPFNHTGPGQSDALVVASFARQVARIEAGLQPPVVRVGALDSWRDFLDVRDVCRAYAHCLARAAQIAPGTIFNIASGTSRRIGDILADLLALSGVEAEIATEANRLRPADIPLAACEGAIARASLEWAPVIPWQRTLSDTLQDWRTRSSLA